MTKRRKKPAVKRISRNPLARVLAGGKYRARVVKPVGLYRRRPKHRAPATDSE